MCTVRDWEGIINCYFLLVFLILSLSMMRRCSLKMEFEKLAQEKTEMQRHYVMVG